MEFDVLGPDCKCATSAELKEYRAGDTRPESFSREIVPEWIGVAESERNIKPRGHGFGWV